MIDCQGLATCMFVYSNSGFEAHATLQNASNPWGSQPLSDYFSGEPTLSWGDLKGCIKAAYNGLETRYFENILTKRLARSPTNARGWPWCMISFMSLTCCIESCFWIANRQLTLTLRCTCIILHHYGEFRPWDVRLVLCTTQVHSFPCQNRR